MRQPLISSYSEAQKFFSNVRSKAKGKPVRSWARLFVTDDESFYELRTTHGTPICKISKDNTLTFLLADQQINSVSHILSYSLPQVIPMVYIRASKGIYRVMHTKQVTKMVNNTEPYYFSRCAAAVRKHGHEVFYGMTFDLNTGKCLNAKANLKDRVNKDKNLEWRRKLIAFKRAIKVRSKLGVIDTVLRNMNLKDRASITVPAVTPDEYFNGIKNAIDTGEVTNDLFETSAVFFRTFYWLSFRTATADSGYLEKNILLYTTSNSVRLRKSLNVFNEE
jgi:hypothetical protein